MISAPERTAHFRTLEQLGRSFRMLTPVEAPDAPGFHFFAGEVHATDFGLASDHPPSHLSGKGFSQEQAFVGCVGEGVEHLSRLIWGDETLIHTTPSSFAHGLDTKTLNALLAMLPPEYRAGDTLLDWVAATRLHDKTEVWIPADLCFKRLGVVLPSAISTGCATGESRDDATLRALLELIERDAGALWWLGGRGGRDISLETLGEDGVLEWIKTLRQDRNHRATHLLDITSDLGVPCVVAMSFDAKGKTFARGLAAGLSQRQAISGALLELCQSELSRHLVLAKRKVRGEKALNEIEQAELQRAESLDGAIAPALYPVGCRLFPSDETFASLEKSAALEKIVSQLHGKGITCLQVDLTRSALGIPSVRILAPLLQPFPSSIQTARLQRQLSEEKSKEVMLTNWPFF